MPGGPAAFLHPGAVPDSSSHSSSLPIVSVSSSSSNHAR